MYNQLVNKKHKRVIFISDLHLDPALPHITEQFISLLKHLNGDCDQLYILGDLFEQWIGDDNENEFTHSIINALRHASDQGTSIFIMLGNRDFLLGKQFLRQTKCILLPDETVIDAFGSKILLMHGDTLCTHDKSYQYFRKIVRNRIFKFIYTSLPLSMREYLANGMRNKSKQHTNMKSAVVMDVAEEAVITAMRKHGVNYLIHGHTHKPHIHTHHDQNTVLTRVVLAAWHDVGSAYIWNDSKREMVPLTHLA